MLKIGIFPTDEIGIRVWKSEELLQAGFKPVQDMNDYLADTLHYTMRSVQRFFSEQLKLAGIDNEGKVPPFFIRLGENNAFCSPEMNAECFAFEAKFVNKPAVVCHEYTHEVVAHRNPFQNTGEEGALNESIADVAGIVFDRSMSHPNWKISDLRDMSKRFTVKDLMDNGNAHHNSLLCSHAFYLAAQNLNNFNGDPGNITLLKIWMEATLTLKDKTFKGFANRTLEVAKANYANRFAERIKNAWVSVGLIQM